MPRLWPGEVVAVVGAGPSLTQEQVDYLKGRCRVMVVNRSWELAPDADWLHACDAKWWQANPEAYTFAGIKTTLEPGAARDGVHRLVGSGHTGFDPNPSYVRTGGQSAYQAAHMAVHAGARKIVLLGVDGAPAKDGRLHWHPPHQKSTNPSKATFARWQAEWPTLAKPLREMGVEVVNATPGSAINCFPLVDLDAALS